LKSQVNDHAEPKTLHSTPSSAQKHPYSSRAYLGKPASQYEETLTRSRSFVHDERVSENVREAVASTHVYRERTFEEDPLKQPIDTNTPTKYQDIPSVALDSINSNPASDLQDDDTPRAKKTTDYQPDVNDARGDEKVWAQKIFNGDEDFIQKDRAAAWLGDS